MNIRQIDADEVDDLWPSILKYLEPAIELDPEHTVNDVRLKLKDGRFSAIKVFGEAKGYIILRMSIDMSEGRTNQVGWVYYAGGKVSGGPKHKLALMRALLTKIENAAKGGGARQLRFKGRAKWHRLFPEYERVGDELRKAL